MADAHGVGAMVVNSSNLVTLRDWTTQDYLSLFEEADRISYDLDQGTLPTDRFILGSFFFQSSTRTRLSFESAASRLGGSCIGFTDLSSTRYGDYYAESLEDTIAVVSRYCDVAVIRHPDDSACDVALEQSNCPIINAGCGYKEHPTQTLLDFYTLKSIGVPINGSSLGFLGDPQCRVFKSLQFACQAFGVSSLIVLRPPESEYPPLDGPIPIHEVKSSRDLMRNSDALLAIPFQLSDFHNSRTTDTRRNPELSEDYMVSNKLIAEFPSTPVLHCGPRGPELPGGTERSESVYYLEEVSKSVPLRAAILLRAMNS